MDKVANYNQEETRHSILGTGTPYFSRNSYNYDIGTSCLGDVHVRGADTSDPIIRGIVGGRITSDQPRCSQQSSQPATRKISYR